MDTFLAMTEMRSHQELKQRGELVEYDESMGAALFISHQWRAPARKGTVLFGGVVKERPGTNGGGF